MLVREGSRGEARRGCARGWGPAPTASSPSRATCRSRCSGVSEEDRAALAGVEHFFHLAAIYDMTADEERNRRLNVHGTQNAIDLANELGAGPLPPRVLDRRRRRVRGALHRGRLRRRARSSTHPYHRTKFEAEKLVRQRRQGAVARLPALDRRRQLEDRRDGQDRRALLLLQGDPEGPQHAAAVVPADRARGRQDEHRPGRLRGRRDGPHRPPARPRRPGLPPRQPEDAGARATSSTPSRAPATPRRWSCGSTRR